MNATSFSNAPFPANVTDKLSPPIELTVVVPTFNERDNIDPLLWRLERALEGISWEVIFVDDDSSDGTADFVRAVARINARVRIIHRIGRRGLSSACVEGVLSSSSPYFAVIDADMQHDETLLPRMLARLKQDGLDIIVGSRYVEGGGLGSWDQKRQLMSRFANKAARLVLKADLWDPMSGFFLMERQAFDQTVRKLSQLGFKILLDLFASAPRPLRVAELPYEFGVRKHGQSKLDSMVAWEYGMLLADKLFGHIVPPRLLLFGLIGGLGLFVHLITLALALSVPLSFATSQTIAVLVAMTSNFVLNNLITYRDRRLLGWAFLRGLLSFYVICSVGAIANVGIAAYIYSEEPIWWLAGLAGAVVGAVWNYALSAFFTWKR
jgi:dolichol-phosphate mannosyltransferase